MLYLDTFSEHLVFSEEYSACLLPATCLACLWGSTKGYLHYLHPQPQVLMGFLWFPFALHLAIPICFLSSQSLLIFLCVISNFIFPEFLDFQRTPDFGILFCFCSTCGTITALVWRDYLSLPFCGHQTEPSHLALFAELCVSFEARPFSQTSLPGIQTVIHQFSFCF